MDSAGPADSGAGTVAAPDDNGIGKPVSGAPRIKPTKSNP
jgi:hypothetical protein